MRTVEQLGYLVWSGSKSVRDVIGNYFLVQSATKGCPYLVKRLNAHLENMTNKIKNLTDEDFKTNVNAVLTNVKEKDRN